MRLTECANLPVVPGQILDNARMLLVNYAMSHQRQHHRIRYPVMARPRIVVGNSMLEVFDLSESGACVQETPLFVPGAPAREISIIFSDGKEFFIRALFVRTTQFGVAVQFPQMVPLGRILSEQRVLWKRALQVVPASEVRAKQNVKPK